ncbi:LysR family transcriptional regulator [Paraburkholderia sp. Ac-20340]|uniref:LysR family transcriptional regulator n=1 Tax=Paraburkholderia sp. Ac-20340 TaxID=2703888 RepID=UPI00197D4012|nr:LysR family transcriptional regulator [Paraburkholderia sp. Ac-20340]MBN3856713.1 LysR family transcriptional regulator [Paraburkholderia sp. Ac-20340]
MELRQLRYFLAICEHGSIAAAARALHVAQPALSRQIIMLEEELHAELLHRLPRGVALTRAGDAMFKRATEILQCIDQLKSDVRGAQDGASGSLKIGVIPNYGWLPVISELLQKMRADAPNVRIAIEPKLSRHQEEGIRSGELDAGLMAWRSPRDPELSGLSVYVDPLAIAIPKASRGRFSPTSTLQDLRDEDFVMFPRESSPATYDLICRLFQSANITPRITHTAYDIPTLVGLVESGVGFSIVPLSYQLYHPEGVTFVPVTQHDFRLDIEFVWKTTNNDPILRRVVGLIKALLAAEP